MKKRAKMSKKIEVMKKLADKNSRATIDQIQGKKNNKLFLITFFKNKKKKE